MFDLGRLRMFKFKVAIRTVRDGEPRGPPRLSHSSRFLIEDVPLVEFMYLAYTRMPGESYRRRLGSLLLYLCDVFER